MMLVRCAHWRAAWFHPLNVARYLYPMDLAHKSDEEILAVAGPIMDNLMEASTDIDHERHMRDFTERLKALVTKHDSRDLVD
ncbi:MAG: hypothetical protein OJF47_000076 [Nitrospira sp.]|nr:MAG: hypothetical protein OJF47_000076 [Nitrospira sp.]